MNAAVSLLLTASGAVLPPPDCGPKAILLPPQPDGSCLQSLSPISQAPLIPQPPPPTNIRTRGRPSRDEAFILFSPPPLSHPPMNSYIQSQPTFSPYQMHPRPMPPPTLRDLLYQNHMLQMQNALLRQRLLQYEQQSLMGALLMTAMRQRLPQPPPQPSSFHLSRRPSTMPQLPRPFPPNFYHYDVVPAVTAAPPGPPSPPPLPPFFAGGAFPGFRPRSNLQQSSKSQHPLFVLFQRRRKRAARLDPQLPAFTAPIKRSRARPELGEERRKKLEWSCVSMGGQCLCCCGGRRPDASGICREETAELPLPSVLQLAPTHPAQEMAMELAKEEFWPMPLASSTPTPPPTTQPPSKSQRSHLDKHFPSIARILKLR